MNNPTVSVTADLRAPISGTTGTGTVAFELMSPLADPPTLWGDNTTFTASVVAGAFTATVVLEANAFWLITVQTDVLRRQFEVYVPASPSSTTLAALWELALATPTVPDQYIPYSSRGVPGGVATLDGSGTVPLDELPAGLGGSAPLWQQALDHAGLQDPSVITDHVSDPAQPITLAPGFYENLRFTCTQLIVNSSLTTLRNCDVVTSNNDYGVRVDANTGFEVGRRFEHCRFTGQGVVLAGAGYTARLCEAYHNGDDFARVGRSYAEPTVLELCYAHDFKPKSGAHADGVQVVTPPAADVVVTGCVISMNTAAGYTLPGDAGYTGALFVDTDDVPIPDNDAQPTRRGMIRVSDSKLFSSNNYTIVISGPNTDISDCTLLPGTTALENITGGNFVTGRGNVDASGVPIARTDITGSPNRQLLVGDSRITLSTLGDVDVSDLADGQVPTWHAATSTWLPRTPTASGGGGTLAGLTDVDLTGAQPGQVLALNGTTHKWQPITPSGGGSGFTPIRVTSGPTLGTFGPGGSGPSSPPRTQAPSWTQLKLTADEVSVGDLIHWSMPIISTGGDAQCDVASIVAGQPVNFYSDNYGPTQNENGHSGLYMSGDFGHVQGPMIWWVVQETDLAGDGSLTLSFLYFAGGAHVWGSNGIPGQVDMVNFGPHN